MRRAPCLLAFASMTLVAIAAACGGTVSYRTGRCTGSSCSTAVGGDGPRGKDAGPGDTETWHDDPLTPPVAGVDQPLLLASSRETLFAAGNGIFPGTTWRTAGIWARDVAGDAPPNFIGFDATVEISAIATDGTSTFVASGSHVSSLARELGSWFTHDLGTTSSDVCALRVAGARVVTVERDGTVTAWSSVTRERRILGAVEAVAAGEACPSVDVLDTRVAVATVSTLSVFDDSGTTPARATITHGPRLTKVGARVTMQGDVVALARPHSSAPQQLAFYKLSLGTGSGSLVPLTDGTDAQTAATHTFACSAGCSVARREGGLAVSDAAGVTTLALDATGHVTGGRFTALAMGDHATLQDDGVLTAFVDAAGARANVFARPVDSAVAQPALSVPTTPATRFGHAVAAIESGNLRLAFVADDSVVWGYTWRDDRWLLDATFTPALGERVVDIHAGSTGTRLAVETTTGTERTLWDADFSGGLWGVGWNKRPLEPDALWAIDAGYIAIASGDPWTISVAPTDALSPVIAFSAPTSFRANDALFLRAGADQVVLVNKADGRYALANVRSSIAAATVDSRASFNLLQPSESLIDLLAHQKAAGLGLAVWRGNQAYFGDVAGQRPSPLRELHTKPNDVILGATKGDSGTWLVANASGGTIVGDAESLEFTATENPSAEMPARYRFAACASTLVLSGPWRVPVRTFSLR